jgi:hypothetical protein
MEQELEFHCKNVEASNSKIREALTREHVIFTVGFIRFINCDFYISISSETRSTILLIFTFLKCPNLLPYNYRLFFFWRNDVEEQRVEFGIGTFPWGPQSE